MQIHFFRMLQVVVVCLLWVPFPAAAADKVTILYDAFGDAKGLTEDWGFSALVEHGRKRILFDTGNNAAIFAQNMKALGVDLGRLDFVMISHRRADHATGLKYVLKVNPRVTVVVPADGFNGFGGAPLPATFFRPVEDLPAKMRYFDGKYPEQVSAGKLYDMGNIVLVNKLTQVMPGVLLVPTTVEEIDALTESLKTEWKVQRIAPGHCMGEPAFVRLKKAYGENYVYAGLGTAMTVE